MRKRVPRFNTEAAERRFWATHDTTDYVEMSQATRWQFPRLKPTLRTISVRLPEYLIGELKALANARDIPYQSLLKQFLVERMAQEWRHRHAA